MALAGLPRAPEGVPPRPGGLDTGHDPHEHALPDGTAERADDGTEIVEVLEGQQPVRERCHPATVDGRRPLQGQGRPPCAPAATTGRVRLHGAVRIRTAPGAPARPGPRPAPAPGPPRPPARLGTE
ncbi:hypothetical protein KFL01_31750 [Kocuria flava]|uniref:Uncharacterized protein n=1 Tax=Kocuria flava TaxID=446860 RepID=A0ABQ0XDB7_9MICC|nr:hypothetical protein KFL01_31750 [Kocuria flava]